MAGSRWDCLLYSYSLYYVNLNRINVAKIKYFYCREYLYKIYLLLCQKSVSIRFIILSQNENMQIIPANKEIKTQLIQGCFS